MSSCADKKVKDILSHATTLGIPIGEKTWSELCAQVSETKKEDKKKLIVTWRDPSNLQAVTPVVNFYIAAGEDAKRQIVDWTPTLHADILLFFWNKPDPFRLDWDDVVATTKPYWKSANKILIFIVQLFQPLQINYQVGNVPVDRFPSNVEVLTMDA